MAGATRGERKYTLFLLEASAVVGAANLIRFLERLSKHSTSESVSILGVSVVRLKINLHRDICVLKEVLRWRMLYGRW